MEGGNKRFFMTDGQKKLLLELIGGDENIIKGKFSNTYTHQIAQQRWTDIASQLNAIPGAQKSWVQWKKTWQDLKKSAKKKNTELKTYTQGTGGGPPRTLSENDKIVLEILDATAVDGDKSVEESVVEIMYEESENLPTEENIEKEYEISTVLTEVQKENAPCTSPVLKNELSSSNKPKNRITPKVKRILKSRNLEESIKSSNSLITLSERREKLKENYYKEKIGILKNYYEQILIIERKKVELKEKGLEVQIRIAEALEEIV